MLLVGTFIVIRYAYLFMHINNYRESEAIRTESWHIVLESNNSILQKSNLIVPTLSQGPLCILLNMNHSQTRSHQTSKRFNSCYKLTRQCFVRHFLYNNLTTCLDISWIYVWLSLHYFFSDDNSYWFDWP